MILNVSDALRNPGQEYRFGGEQAIAPVDVYGEQISFDDAAVQGTYFADTDGSIAVDGDITTIAHGCCAKCLRSAKASISCTFKEAFIRNGDPEDDEIFSYQGYQVSLEKLVMSYCVLELPIRFLCSSCSSGIDAVQGFDAADSSEMQTQHPFAGLADLLEANSNGSTQAECSNEKNI